MNKFLKYLFISFFFLISVNIYAISTYRHIDLGLQESDQSDALAVNDKGHVVGSYWMLGTKYYFFWSEKNGISLINLPESAKIVVLNIKDQIAGNYIDSSGNERGFLWDKDSGFNDLGTLGGNFTRVFDMNDFTQIVGESESSRFSSVDDKVEVHAFLWNHRTMTCLNTLNGDLGFPGDKSVATGINNQGQIVGTSNTLIAHKRKFLRSENRAVIWQNGVVEEIDPSHKGRSASLSINDNGLIIYHKYNHIEYGHYLLDLNNQTNIRIKQFVGDDYFAKLNNTDQILYFPENIQNVLLTSKRQANELMFKIQNTNSYSSLCLWTLFSKISTPDWDHQSFIGAYDFNNNNWIVGVAKNIYGEKHAILLVPNFDNNIISASKESSEKEIIKHEEKNIKKIEENVNGEIKNRKMVETNSLHKAIDSNDWDTVDALIEKKEGLNYFDLILNPPSSQKFFGPPLIKLLLLYKSMINFDSYNKTILSFIKKFIVNGADLNLKCNPCWGDSLKYEFCETTIGNSLFLYAFSGESCNEDWIEIAEILVKKGVKANFLYGRSKWKPIQYILQMPSIEKLEILHRFGATVDDIDCFSWLGFTNNSHTYDAELFKKIVYFLLENGANPHRQSDRNKDYTQLQQCIKNIEIMPVPLDFKKTIKSFLEDINLNWNK